MAESTDLDVQLDIQLPLHQPHQLVGKSPETSKSYQLHTAVHPVYVQKFSCFEISIFPTGTHKNNTEVVHHPAPVPLSIEKAATRMCSLIIAYTEKTLIFSMPILQKSSRKRDVNHALQLADNVNILWLHQFVFASNLHMLSESYDLIAK